MHSQPHIGKNTHIHNDYVRIANVNLPKKYLRIGLPTFIGLLFLFDNNIRPIVLGAIADAYINVGVFVAATLLLYYIAESYFGFDITTLKEKAAWQQISIAALLGALPGCGGAIIVVSQYAAGHMSFAALVAVLVATMGDAAFLLLAKAPKVGIMVVGLGLGVGILSGLVVHALHSPDFMRQSDTQTQANLPMCQPLLTIPKKQVGVWMLLFLLSLPFTLLSAFQVDVADINFFNLIMLDAPLMLGVSAGVICLVMWALLPIGASYYRGLVAQDSVAIDADNNNDQTLKNQTFTPNQQGARKSAANPLTNVSAEQTSAVGLTNHNTTGFWGIIYRVVHDTNFIMVWVILAFLLFELFIHYTGVSLEGLFDGALWLAPLVGVLVGFLPGCGPQIIISSLYLQGVAPLSTLLGNAISNDGDALFPAIALTPKAAMLATLYSAIPALFVAYGMHFLLR